MTLDFAGKLQIFHEKAEDAVVSYLQADTQHEVDGCLRKIPVINGLCAAYETTVNPGVAFIFRTEKVVDAKVEPDLLDILRMYGIPCRDSVYKISVKGSVVTGGVVYVLLSDIPRIQGEGHVWKGDEGKGIV